MISLPTGMRVWFVAAERHRREEWHGRSCGDRAGGLGERPFSRDVFVLRGRRGNLIKLPWWSDDLINLYATRLERGRFLWPQAAGSVAHLTVAHLSMLLVGIDLRQPATFCSHNRGVNRTACRPTLLRAKAVRLQKNATKSVI